MSGKVFVAGEKVTPEYMAYLSSTLRWASNMPTFTFYKCNKCKKNLGGHDAYQSVGEPFLVCPQCQSVNVIAKNRTEWALKSKLERFSIKAKVWFFSAVLGSGTAIFIGEGLKSWQQINLPYFISFTIGVGIWYWIMNKDLQRYINESQERMKDQNYVAALGKLGLKAHEKA